jgi:hypothetical protein
MAHPATGYSSAPSSNPKAESIASEAEIVRYIDLKLAALGYSTSRHADSEFLEIARPLLRNYHQKDLMLGHLLCPADRRIQAFLDDYLKYVSPRGAAPLPGNTFLLDRPGLARVMSLPLSSDTFTSPYLRSYRLPQGILHNPKSDRRTTQGIFHIVEGGLAIPADKLAVPRQTFAALLAAALAPPADLMTLPFSADREQAVRLFVSLLLRPIVCPATERDPQKTMEIRFFAPGSLVSNLDFVEGIFGNAGDPYLPENDAALDVMRWTGHTGCVIVAPHLAGIKKKDVGLPHEKDATERQRRDGMFWRDPEEPYNGGGSFKVACRDERGVMVTIIADNYYGYCKKEVKTQISFAANLYGLCEEGAFSGGDAPVGIARRGKAGRLRNRPPLPGYSLRPGRFRVQRARRHVTLEAEWTGGTAFASRRHHLRAPQRLPVAHGEAIRRLGLEACRRAPQRNPVPQAVHGFGGRQIGDFQIDRQRHPRGPRVRGRLSARRRAGG